MSTESLGHKVSKRDNRVNIPWVCEEEVQLFSFKLVKKFLEGETKKQ